MRGELEEVKKREWNIFLSHFSFSPNFRGKCKNGRGSRKSPWKDDPSQTEGKCYKAVFELACYRKVLQGSFFYSGVFQESFTEHIAGKSYVKGWPVAVLQPNSGLLNREI